MANFGAKYPCFAPFKGVEPTNALPKYDAKVVVGKLVSANLTVNLASGELYVDDALTEQLSEFASGTIAMETDDMLDDVAAVVYGATAGYIQQGRHGPLRRPGVLQDPHAGRREVLQGLLLSQGAGGPGQRQRPDQGQLHHLRHQQYHVYRLRRQYRRLADYRDLRQRGGGKGVGGRAVGARGCHARELSTGGGGGAAALSLLFKAVKR